MMKNTTLNINGCLLNIQKPIVMGILNASPDSFFHTGQESTLKNLLYKAAQMEEEGAVILDIGGMSTRPGAAEITEEEEWHRIGDLIKALKKRGNKAFISVDTYRSEIARRAIIEGADLINDISAGSLDPKMLDTVARARLPYIAMHMQGEPRTMQDNPQYENVVQDILAYFIQKIKQCEAAGIKDIIIDPGFGFGKTLEQNYELLKGLHQFLILKQIMLVGLSRKSFIYKLLKTEPENALNGTTALNMLALKQGARILRVHDVREAKECIELFDFFERAGEYAAK